MATRNSRDVRMTLSVETLGQDEILSLKKAVEQLAAEGGDAAPEFQALADQIGRLGAQNEAVSTVRRLGEETAELKTKQEAAAATVAEMGQRLGELRQKAEEARASQEGTAQALQQWRDVGTDAAAALTTLIKTTDAAGKKTQEYKDAVARLILEKATAKKGSEELAAQLQKENAAVAEAERAQSKLEVSLGKASKNATALSDRVSESEQAMRKAVDTTAALGVSTDDLAAAEGNLQLAFKQVAQGANDLKAVNEAAKAAGAALDNAFNDIGIRSANSLRAEIDQVRAAMQQLEASGSVTGAELRGAFAAGNARIKELERDIRGLTGSLTMADKAASLFKNSMGQIAAGNLVADAIASVIERVKEMGREFIRSIVQLDQMRRGLNAIYKDAATTARQIDFLRRTASDAGVSFGGLSAEFVKFSASMHNANVPMAEANALFASVVRASTSLGLGAEETAGSLNALAQMASKGVVSMEELRQQLGDRLPGAFGLMAQGLGITETQLVKLVESGKLATRDAIVPLTKAMTTLHGETTGLLPTWERLLGALRLSAQNAGDAGWTQLLTMGLKALGAAAYAVVMPLSLFTELSGVLARSVGVLAGALATLTNPMDALKEIWGEADDRLTKLNESFMAVVGATTEQKESALAAAAGNSQLMQAINGAKTAADLQRLSNMQAADSTGDLSAKMVQYNVAAEGALKSAQQRTIDTERLAKAARDEGEALVTVAKLRGDEVTMMNASATAAELYAAKLKEAAESKSEEVRILEQQLGFTEQNLAQRKLSVEQIESETKGIKDKVDATKAEEEQALRTAAAAEAEASGRRLAAETAGDQSEKLDDLRVAYEQATLYAEALREAEARGVVGKEAVRKADEAAAKAQYKYRDALSDSAKQIKLAADAKAADLQITRALAGAQQSQLERLEKEALAKGDVAAATKYAVQAKELEVEQMRLSMQIREIELQGEAAALEQQREELRLQGSLTPEKEKELDLRLKLVKVREIENGKAIDGIKLLEDEIKLIKQRNSLPPPPSNSGSGGGSGGSGGGGQGGGSGGGRPGKYDSPLNGRYGSPLNDKYGSPLGNDKYSSPLDGKSNYGNTREERLAGQNAVDNTLMFKLRDKLQAGLLTAADIPELMAVLEANKVNQQIANDMDPGAWSLEGRNDWNAWQNTMQQFQAFVNAQKVGKGGDTSTTKTVNINIGGKNQRVNVNSDADVQNLTSILRQLETQSNTAS